MAYKIRHKPTGLFYRPYSGPYNANLSKRGKLYDRLPSLKWLGGKYKHPVDKAVNYREWEYRPVVADEWEFVEV